MQNLNHSNLFYRLLYATQEIKPISLDSVGSSFLSL